MLNKEEYKNYNAVEDAINAVVRGKTIAEQTTVDGYAAAIENAINALEYKDADYTKVDAAIDKANALNKNDYKDFSGVEAASRLLSVVKILRASVGATVARQPRQASLTVTWLTGHSSQAMGSTSTWVVWPGCPPMAICTRWVTMTRSL